MLDSDLATDIADFLGLDAPPPLFSPCAALCDPMSRPGHDSGVLSVDCAADLLIALCYSTYSKDHFAPLAHAKFMLSMEFALLLKAIHVAVNAHDDFVLREFHRIAIPQYTPPRDTLAHVLRTTYAMACVLLMALHKLFAPPTGIPCLASHPYLHYFIALWKCHTTIITLGLQVDRDIEEANQCRDEPKRTPASVKRALAGSSAIRCVLAWILNMNVNVINKVGPGEKKAALTLATEKVGPAPLQLQEEENEAGRSFLEDENLNDGAAADTNRDSAKKAVKHQNNTVENVPEGLNPVKEATINCENDANSNATGPRQTIIDAERPSDEGAAQIPSLESQSVTHDQYMSPKALHNTLRSIFAHKMGLETPEPAAVSEPQLSLELCPNLDARADDLKCETATDFLRPLIRKHTTLGALKVDMRLLFIGMLFTTVGTSYSMAPLGLSSPFIELSDLLYGLEYSDRYDEDIRYIFECEHEDLGAGDDFEDYDPDDLDFEPQDLLVNNGPDERSVSKPAAERASRDHELSFDDLGHDWRDVPRGENAQYRPQFLAEAAAFEKLSQRDDSNLFFSTWDEMLFAFVFLCHTSIEDELPVEINLGQVVLNTIAYAIMKEEEEDQEDESKSSQDDSAVTPDRIFHYLFTAAPEELVKHLQLRNSQIVPIFEIVSFELLLHANSKLARCILDEMMMSRGYRRVIIWVLVHNMNLLALHIDYVFELLVGLRGIDSKHTPYTFSRMGPCIELSDIELVMLLHEFFASSAQYLASVQGVELDSEHTVYLSVLVATKYVTLICLMIDRLLDLGFINLGRKNMSLTDDMHDFSTDLKLLLIPWVGKVPEARRIYVAMRKALSLESVQTPLRPEAIFEYTPESEESIIKDLSGLLAPWIERRLNVSATHMDAVYKYLKRLDYHLTYLIGHTLPMPPPPDYTVHLERDVRFFFTHFNTLCRIEHLVNLLFEKYEVAVADIAEFDQWTGTPLKTTEKSASLKKRGKRKKKSKRK